MKDRIQKKSERRYMLLLRIYEDMDGRTDMHMSYEELATIGAKLGLTNDETEATLDWLTDEGLVEPFTMSSFKLTHQGVVEIEKSVARPDEETDHFTPAVIQHVTQYFNAPVGAVQSGSHSVANVTQNVSTDVQVLLQQLRAHVDGLDPEQRSDAMELVDGLEEQAKAPTRSKAIIKALVAGLGAIVTGAGGDVLAEVGKKLLGLG